jgi:hypothetical protein
MPKNQRFVLALVVVSASFVPAAKALALGGNHVAALTAGIQRRDRRT